MAKPWRDKPKRDYKPRDPKITSRMMAAVKARGSKAEVALRSTLHARGLRYRLHNARLIGKPDLVFSRSMLVVFVDGDFWHGRALIEEGLDGLKKGLRTERAGWWIEKISRTVERDLNVTKTLEEQGWEVIRVWESEVLQNPSKLADLIELRVKDRAYLSKL